VRTIREENAASTALDDALDRWSRTTDASGEAITWIIARDPEIGTAVNESGSVRTYLLDGVRSIDLLTVTLLYEIADTEIIILDARFSEPRHQVSAGRSGCRRLEADDDYLYSAMLCGHR
jgi:hypothetical protein